MAAETAKVSTTPVTIDYTNRDFYSLREELISRVKARVPGWYGSDSSDFGVALVEAFAYVGDITSYYIDRVANESNLATASQRDSVINLARTYGYSPAGYQAASCTVQFSNSSSTPKTIPSGTEVSGKMAINDIVQQVIFTTTESVSVPENSSSAVTVTAKHGYYVSARNPAIDANDVAGVLIGSASGDPAQAYTLSENQIVDGSICIFVQNGDSFGEWGYVLHLADYGPNDAVFTTVTDANNYVTVVFGDGVSGAIPPKFASIKADYVVGGGIIGNIQSGVLTSLYSVPGMTSEDVSTLAAVISVNNTTSASGGIDPDSLDTIRALAPKAFTSLNRAVTLEDYANISLQLPNVGKANAVSAVGTSVTVYVAPRRTDTTTDPYPLYNDTNTLTTVEWDAGDSKTGLKFDVYNELISKSQIGVSVTVAPPTYAPVTMTILYNKLPQYTSAQVEEQLRNLLSAYYSYSLVVFEQTVYPEDIEFLLKYAPGATNVKVVEMYRSEETPGRKVLIGGPGELFIFDVDNVAISAASTNAALNSLTTGSGTVLPTFSKTFYNYNLTVSTGTSSVSLTPAADDTAHGSVYVNGTHVAYGDSISVTTSTPTTTVTIKVIAQDLVTSETYTLTITKA